MDAVVWIGAAHAILLAEFGDFPMTRRMLQHRAACRDRRVGIRPPWCDSAVDVAMPGPWQAMHRVSHDVVLIESSDHAVPRLPRAQVEPA